MTREELEQIIEKYRTLSENLYTRDKAKSNHYRQFSDWVENNIDTLEDVDEFATDEEELWNNFLEEEEESGKIGRAHV